MSTIILAGTMLQRGEHLRESKSLAGSVGGKVVAAPGLKTQLQHALDIFFHRALPKLRRGFWILMLLLHVPTLARYLWATPNKVADSGDYAAIIGLALAFTLFVLKILDVRWLRFKTDRRAVFALVLAVTLAHVSLLRFSDELVTHPAQPLLLSNILIASSLIAVRRYVRDSLGWLNQPTPTPKAIHISGRWRQPASRSLSTQWLAHPLASPRAPPARA